MFPCRHLTQTASLVLGSQNMQLGDVADFDKKFASHVTVHKVKQLPLHWERVDCSQVSMNALKQWLNTIIGDTWLSSLGHVPVSLHMVTLVGCVSSHTDVIVKLEFMTKRFGDGHGSHYVAIVGTKPQFRLLWFKKVGVVAQSDIELLPGPPSTVDHLPFNL